MLGNVVIPWVTIETLAPEVMTVASVGAAPRDFVGWQRVLQRFLSKIPAVYDGCTPTSIAESIETVRARAEEVDRTISTRSGPYVLKLRPILGPAGDVHAVRMWLGPEAAAVPPAGVAVGAIWDLDTQTLQLPSGSTRLPGVSPEQYVPRMSIAELFHQMSTFDRHGEVLDLLYRPNVGEKLQFDVAITDRFGRPPGQWRITIRARDDERTRGAWWLIEDVTSEGAAAQWPTLERVGLREAHRRAGTHLAVVQLEHTSISHWLTDPAPWIRWDYLFRPVDVFHPEDRSRLVELAGRLRSGDTAGVTIRTLDYGGGYTPTSLLLYPYPGYTGSQLAIAQLVRIADNRPVLEQHRGQPEARQCTAPIGYDDQLRNWLAGRTSRSPVY